MSEEDREAEDVTGLFRKFGGDASGYREFEPVLDPAAPPAAWPLIPGSRAAAAPAQPQPPTSPRAAAPQPTPVPAAAIPSPVQPSSASPTHASRAAPVTAPLAAAVTAAPHALPTALPAAWAASPPVVGARAGEPRELDLLFARLAGQPRPAVDGGHGLMSRWRKPT
ncbi:hypothetical protein QTH87_13585 [Variovorax sp. J22P168]|uniref:hypothetical protein n=1 Tax=Variovorax jilinensis TaxID=3053513 RepID=UPI0025757986|nr:hypothetical protein [Variovorax sp. J22P168]MDM0013468.1 hypothetical protein [Variovorax sp. J22P168]